MDHEEYRAQSRATWDAVAPGWGARAAALQEAALPVSQWLVDAIAPVPGETVVELAAGAGDTGFLAARRLRPAEGPPIPGGGLLSTDGSPAMVDIARARAAEQGLDDIVQCRVMEAEWIDLSAATVDAVLCRWGYMLLADPQTALRETRRILRPDGRLALAGWADPADNPWNTTGGGVLRARGLAPEASADPQAPGMYAFAQPEHVEDLLAGAGFADVRIDTVDFAFIAPDGQAWWEYLADTSPSLRAALPGLSPADVYGLRDALDEAYAPYTDPDGVLTLPARALVAAATA